MSTSLPLQSSNQPLSRMRPMKTANLPGYLRLLAVMACALSVPVSAAVLTNGSFESGFTGWTRADQLGSESTFLLQTGTSSPLNAFAVPAPPAGTTAAMTDAFGPGSHVLYQDFVVPTTLTAYSLGFSLYINNGHDAPNFFTPATLDFSTPALNQRARVDIVRPAADPFSIAAADVLQNVYETAPGAPLVSGYTPFVFDITTLFQAHPGETLRLRFAEVDNVAPFNLGVDNVSIQEATGRVPDTLPWIVPFLTLGGLIFADRARRRSRA